MQYCVIKKKEKTCLLMVIAVPVDSKGNKKETEQLSKYEDLEDRGKKDVESEDKTVPAVIGALGTIKKGLDKKIELLSGHRSATELEKVRLMSTAYSTGKCWGKSLWSIVEFCTYQQTAT